MHTKVFFKNIESTPNIECFILMRLESIYPFVAPGDEISVSLNFDEIFTTLIVLENAHHRFAFSAEADTISESCSRAIHLLSHFLREKQRLNKKKIQQYYGETSGP